MPGILCEHCTGLCCRYIALPLDNPESRRDFDDIRWYMLHEGISVFVEDGDWYLNVQTKCRHLQENFFCGIYEKRPRVCREYSTDNCEYHAGDYEFEHHFLTPEQLEEFAPAYLRDLRRKAKEKKKKTKRRKRLGLKPRKRGLPGIEQLNGNGMGGRDKNANGHAKSNGESAASNGRGVRLPILGSTGPASRSPRSRR